MDIKIELQDLLASYLEDCNSDDINDIVSNVVGRDLQFDNTTDTMQDLVRGLEDAELSATINYFLLQDAREDEADMERQNSN